MSEPIIADDEAGLGCLATGRGNLPLDAVDIDAHITGLLYTSRVRQTFTNPYDEPLEATYIFPLPDRAAVTAFRMEVGDRVIDGLLQERADARRAYDEAISTGRRAAIAEEERPNTFSVRVGNLVPGDRATVELTLAGPLALDSGEATWRFPLVVAPRYIPGVALPGPSVGDGTATDTDAVPDASRITPPVLLPGFPNPVRLSVRVDLDDAGLPVSGVRSSLPADVDGTVITIRPGQRLDRDLVIRFDVGADVVGSSLVTYDGTFALTLVPPVRAAGPSKPRDIAFVLDRSGSMDGWKMTAARRAVARMIDTLGAADRFAVIAFDSRVETPSTLDSGLVTATDRHRFRAVEYLATLTARGGTEMLTPLQTAVSLLAGDDSERQRVLVLATDGQVGNEDQILAAIGADAANIRIFTVGIDTAVNDAFLRRIAAVGGGNCELVESEDRLDEVMERIHRRIGAPVLGNIAITGIGLDIVAPSIAPARIPALHEGAPLVVLGRFAGADDGAIRVTATDAAGKPWSTQVPLSGDGSSAQVAVWARAHIRDLEDRYVVASGDEAIEREIVRTSLDGHVLSRFTAFVAVDTRVVVDGGTTRRITQPVDAPHGWDMFEASVDQARYMAAVGSAAHPMPTSMPAPMAAMAAPVPAAGGFGAAAHRLLRKSAPRHREQPKREAATPVDLTPYRKRAAELTELVVRGNLDADGLRRALVDLVEDLRSVDAAEADIADLVRLIALIDDGNWSAEPLRAFAAGRSARPFWK
jgi:Ca-activated chloride channel family protein